MERKILFCKGIITGIVTFVGDKMGIQPSAMILLITLMSLDYISGMLASKKEAIEHPHNKKYGWSSKKSIIGIYKKVGYVLTIFVAISTDFIIFKFLEEITGIDSLKNTKFGLLVTVWFILNELLSILENAVRMGVRLPASLKNILTDLRKNIEEEN